MDKPKIFIRYPGGGSGTFLCLVLASLVHPLIPAQYTSGHNDIGTNPGRYHNFHEHITRPNFQHKFNNWDATDSELVDLVQGQFEFYPTFFPFYLVPVHLIRTDMIHQAIPNVNLVVIKFDESDHDQLAYNWVCKYLLKFKNQNVIATKLKAVQEIYGRLQSTTADSLGTLNSDSDTRLLTWISKHAVTGYWKNYCDYAPRVPETTIQFRSLFDGSFANSIERVANELGIVYNDTGLQRAQALITQYAANQQLVPWELKLEDYE